ncbi:DEAD/DEAH box helicase [Salinivibrio kushneri]|uniref:DEAD/DEAH box helicase n=1 Tax=Salinivibrio kushneri TaxID=1908198 RepID=UPI00098876DA|nr:DEAD/DEAH box helicase [Salinivibrio kushneri]OOE52176.1 ATP-dependent RNA helicase [Salinivibrio kushneri]WBA10662.1 DEAD/DEAH box helicase [Salinivibrio kushneri]
MSFSSLGLSAPLLKAVQEQGYTTPSPIQEKAIPAVIEGQDVMAAAQTGTGKTAGFTLPILERLQAGKRARPNHVRTLILTPTRELAAQVHKNVEQYSQHTSLSSMVVFGGVKINPQMMKLRKGADVLVATPGRLLDLYQQNAVRFSQLEVLVLDEADRMLDMGFIRDIRKILGLLPAKRQNLLFSATFSADIRQLAKELVNNPVEISVSPANQTATGVEQCIYPVDKKKKPAMLLSLIADNNWQQVLVFSKTKHGANRLSRYLDEYGVSAAAIHGNKSQGARTKALEQFKTGDVRVLVATDIAARGIDIAQLPQVVNFDLPHVAEDYVHRIGRTGRAGAVGNAVSLVCADEAKDLFAIERLIKKVLPRHSLADFPVANPVPESKLDTRPMKPKKPKKNKPRQDGQRSGDNARGHKPVGKNRRHTHKPSGGKPNSSRSQSKTPS